MSAATETPGAHIGHSRVIREPVGTYEIGALNGHSSAVPSSGATQTSSVECPSQTDYAEPEAGTQI